MSPTVVDSPGSAPSLSVVIPAYNDAAVIERTVETVSRFLDAQAAPAELLVVDDGSTDATAAVVERLAAADRRVRLLRLGRNWGKGAAVRAGMLAATGEALLFTDADLSTPIEELDKLRAKLDEGFDVAIGSRALPASRVEVHQGVLRERAGQTFNFIVQLLVLRGFRDTQCGFKCFRRDAARALFGRQRARGFEFDVELLCIARELGLAVAEVPVIWRNNPKSHVRFVRDSTRMFLGLLDLRRRYPPPNNSEKELP